MLIDKNELLEEQKLFIAEQNEFRNFELVQSSKRERRSSEIENERETKQRVKVKSLKLLLN